MKRIISLGLAAALAAVSLSACSTGTGDGASATASPVTETTVSATETSLEDIYPYPEADFDGASFDFLILRSGYYGQDYDDLYVESDSGDVVDSAVVKRNTLVEDRYNVTIAVTESSDPVGQMAKLVRSDDDTYKAVQAKMVDLMATLATQKYLADLAENEYITFEAPWYDQNVINDISIDGMIFTLAGDMTISDKIGICAVMFNKQLAADYSLPDLYSEVTNGTWTSDKLYEYAALASKDLNGDGEMTKTDQWGLITEDFWGLAFMTGGGFRIAEKDEDDIPYFAFSSENAVNLAGKAMEIMYDSGVRAGSGFEAEDYMTVFSEDRALFQLNVMSSISLYRSMDTDFGIIPVPKADEAQESYSSAFSPWVTRTVSVPVTCGDDKMIGIIFDAMSRTGTDTVMSAYYDVMLTSKIARDNESASMLDIIFGSVSYDIGAVFNWGGTWFMYQSFFNSKNDNYVSYTEKSVKAADKALAKTITAFAELKESKS